MVHERIAAPLYSPVMDKQNIFHAMSVGKKAPEEINVIIEIAKGSRVKYEFNKQHGIVFVDRILHTPIPYPFSYGLIPQTWNDFDHDPLDAIVIASESLQPGCAVSCRVIGMLSVEDTGERDDKVLCVPTGDPYYKKVKDIESLADKEREDIEYFLTHYKDLEPGKECEVKAWVNAEKAHAFINECIEVYQKKYA